MKEPPADELKVNVETPEGVVWEGMASAVSSKNSVGPFDILPEHANMVTLVDGDPITVSTSAGDTSFTFAKSVISVNDNSVSIFGDIVSADESGGDKEI